MINFSTFIKLIYMHVFAVFWAVSYTAIASGSPLTEPCTQRSELAQPCSFELPAKTIQQLKIDAGFGWGIFNGSIYNGSNEYTITRLVVRMEPIHDHHAMEMMDGMPMSHEAKIHQIEMNLAPLTKGALSMALEGGDVHIHDFEWEVLKVFGYNASAQ